VQAVLPILTRDTLLITKNCFLSINIWKCFPKVECCWKDQRLQEMASSNTNLVTCHIL